MRSCSWSSAHGERGNKVLDEVLTCPHRQGVKCLLEISVTCSDTRFQLDRFLRQFLFPRTLCQLAGRSGLKVLPVSSLKKRKGPLSAWDDLRFHLETHSCMALQWLMLVPYRRAGWAGWSWVSCPSPPEAEFACSHPRCSHFLPMVHPYNLDPLRHYDP